MTGDKELQTSPSPQAVSTQVQIVVSGTGFLPLARILKRGLDALGLATLISEGRFDPLAANLVLGWPDLMGTLESECPAQCILYNLEPLVEGDHLDRLLRLASHCEVWDSDPENIRLLRAKGSAGTLHLVPVPLDGEDIAPGVGPEDLQVLVCGGSEEDRRTWTRTLNDAGIKTEDLSEQNWTSRLGRAPVVLALPSGNGSWEQLTALAGLWAARKAVVMPSESLQEWTALEAGAISAVPGSDVVRVCRELTANREARIRQGERGHQFLQNRRAEGILKQILGGEAETPPEPAPSHLTIRRIMPSRYVQSIQIALAERKTGLALGLAMEGARFYPTHQDLLKLLIVSAERAGRPEILQQAILRFQELERRGKGPAPGFFAQNVQVRRIADRMDLIRPLCEGKRVLHVGCTDHPIFDPGNNLHIQLAKGCAVLDGLDVDEAGIDELRRWVPGRYFTAPEQVTEAYDVVLVPETIEHVDDLRGFLNGLASIRFKQLLITAPNAFLPEDNGNAWQEDGSYVENIHPDHNCWFSPYTLNNCIRKFTPWKVTGTFLIGNDSVVACLCEGRPRWELERIPKKVHFYWGNDRTSFLRYLSVWSFSRLNPDWELNVYMPASRYQGGIPWRTGEGYDGAQFSGRDYSEALFTIPGLRLHEVDFSAFPEIAEAPENYKSDFFRWHILSEMGGLYSDIDLLYLRPMSELYLNLREDRDAEAVICLQEWGNIIGFLMAAPGCDLFQRLLARSQDAFHTASYQAISAPMVNELFPSMESIRQHYPDMKVLNMTMGVVYPLDHTRVPEIFLTDRRDCLKQETLGIHWYAGHPVAQEMNNVVNSDNFHLLEGTIFQALKTMYPPANALRA